MLTTAGGRSGGLALAIGLLIALAALDWVTHAAVSFAPLFVAPVAVAALVAGRWSGLGVAGLALVTEAVIDTAVGRARPEPLLHAWEVASVAVAYAIVVQLVTTHAALRERERLYRELELAAREIKTLRGLLRVCAWCGEIRDEQRGEWEPLERYVVEHSDASFTHGICPSCDDRLKQEQRQPG